MLSTPVFGQLFPPENFCRKRISNAEKQNEKIPEGMNEKLMLKRAHHPRNKTRNMEEDKKIQENEKNAFFLLMRHCSGLPVREKNPSIIELTFFSL